MTKYSFNNDSSPAERRRVLRETGASYHDVALSEVGTVQGRYGELEKSSSVTGGLAHRYPPLPETSPWASDPVGQEPPIGIDLSAPVVGEGFEIEKKSLREMSGGEGMNHSDQPSNATRQAATDELSPEATPPQGHQKQGAPSPPSKRRGRSNG